MTTVTVAQIRQQAFTAMGCEMLAALDAPDEGPATEAPAWFATWEAILSRFRSTSELNQLNNAGGAPFVASRPLWLVLQTALWAARQSAGLVVPTLLPALEAAGYDRTFATIAAAATGTSTALVAPAPAVAGDWRAILCEARSRTIRLPAGMRLDLGGVAKGWAADRAAQRLGRAGPALIDAGGDIAASAPPRTLPGWPIGVADPRAPGGQLALLCLTRGGVATSGSDYRRWWRAGRWWHHLIDPRTGLPAESDVLSATVVAPTAREAEMAAKVVIFLGQRDGLAWLEARPRLAGLLVGQDNSVLTSRRWVHHLWR
ncbi:MAG: FAD:protein FMN transferase [Thermomicrobiales bacterium]